MCFVWYCCSNCQHFQLGKACSGATISGEMDSNHWSVAVANRSKSGSLILCSTHGCERGGFELPGAHTSQHLISPMSNASTWSAGCFPVGCLVSPQDALFPSCHQESFTSPPSVCCGASSLPGRQAGSGFLFSPPCLTFLSGSWEEAVSQDKWQT